MDRLGYRTEDFPAGSSSCEIGPLPHDAWSDSGHREPPPGTCLCLQRVASVDNLASLNRNGGRNSVICRQMPRSPP